MVARNGQRVSVAPQRPEVLEGLCTKALRYVPDGRGYGLEAQLDLLLDQDPPRPTAGLEWIVVYQLMKAGFDVKRRWYSPGPTGLPEPEVEAVRKNGPCDQQLLSFVQGFDHGLIRHRPGVDRNWLVAQMVLAWPDATFAIATASYGETRRIRKGLYRYGVKTTLVTTKSCPDRPGRVVIGTYTAMGHNEIECNKRHFFFAANASHALGEQAQRCLLQVDAGFRLFGLMSDDRELSPREHDLLVATFSLSEILVPAHGCEEIKPRVVWVPFHRRGAGAAHNAADVKNRLVWNDPIRNRQLTRLAKAIRAGNLATLSNHFPTVAAALGHHRPYRMIVLVDGMDHLLALAERLPGWPIITGQHVDEIGLTAKQSRLLATRRGLWNTGAAMIVTAAGAESMEPITGGGMTVIIWASSGPGLPPIPPAWRMAPAGVARHILVIDVDEHHHPILAKWTRRRKKAYRDAEWFAPGADPLVERIKRFVAARPRRSQP